MGGEWTWVGRIGAPRSYPPSNQFRQGEMTMYDHSQGSAAQASAEYLHKAALSQQVASASKLAALVERVRQSIAMADNARHTLGGELDRLLGSSPTGQSGSKPAEPRMNTGVVGDLDDVISDLINVLELVNTQANRLSAI